MLLATLLERISQQTHSNTHTSNNINIVRGASVNIHGIQYDSRRIEKEDLFCVLSGIHSHGKQYVQSAIQLGASALLIEESDFASIATQVSNTTAVLTVPDNTIRRAMSLIAMIFFLFHSKMPTIIGITGTDGKTTTIHYIHQLASAMGIKAGYWSTIEYHDGNRTHANIYRQSTPESPDIFRCLSNMVQQGCELAVLETTSHGLSHKTMRMIDIAFDFVGLTNIGSEHLDFHGTQEQYAKDKSNLFAQLIERSEKISTEEIQSRAFVRYEESYKSLCSQRLHANNAKLSTYSISQNKAEYYYDIKEKSFAHLKGSLHYTSKENKNNTELCSSNMQLHCLGTFNAENATLAIALLHRYLCMYCSHDASKTLVDLCCAANSLVSPQGRMQIISHTKDFIVIVDYAHTPQSFMLLLPFVAQKITGRVIVVFGSAGERNIQKRKEQGAVADKYADIIILTDEDPRGENSMQILEQIAAGCNFHQKEKNLFLIPDRETAIAYAISIAQKDDALLFLGKGNEKNIEYASQKILSWDEIAIIKKYL